MVCRNGRREQIETVLEKERTKRGEGLKGQNKDGEEVEEERKLESRLWDFTPSGVALHLLVTRVTA